jgi:hypothetical protein
MHATTLLAELRTRGLPPPGRGGGIGARAARSRDESGAAETVLMRSGRPRHTAASPRHGGANEERAR